MQACICTSDCSWRFLHLQFPSFYFWYSSFFSFDLGAAILAFPRWHVFLLVTTISGGRSEPSSSLAHLLFSIQSFVEEEGRLRCTVKMWQKGNEETLSHSDLDTIQIGFARIPAIYHLSLYSPLTSPHPTPPHLNPPHPTMILSLLYCISNNFPPSHPFPSPLPLSTPFSSALSVETLINREHISLSLLISSPTHKAHWRVIRFPAR